MQHLLTRITSADPLQESQELHPPLALGELAEEPICLQVVDRQKVPHAPLARIRGTQAIHALIGTFPARAVSRLEVQRPKLVDAQPAAIAGALSIQATNGPVL